MKITNEITITGSQALIIRQSILHTRNHLYRTAAELNADARDMFKDELADIDEVVDILAEEILTSSDF